MQKSTRRDLKDYVALDSMEALQEFYEAIGDFLRQTYQQKGGEE